MKLILSLLLIQLTSWLTVAAQSATDSSSSKTYTSPPMYDVKTVVSIADASIDVWTWPHDASRTLMDFIFLAHGTGYLADESSRVIFMFGQDDIGLFRRFCKAMKWVVANPGKQPIEFTISQTRFSESKACTILGVHNKNGDFAVISAYNEKGDIVVRAFTAKDVSYLFEIY